MSLQFESVMNHYSTAAAQLWLDWRSLTRHERLDFALRAIKRATPFLPGITYGSYWASDWGDYGVHYPGLWSIEINRYHPRHSDIELEDFIEWVLTPFHETRHAEQTYRIAQGVLAGELVPPGKNLHRKFQAVMAGKSPRDIVKALESGNPFAVVDQTVRKRVVQEWLDVPMEVINHADSHRSYFKNFLASRTPQWLDYRADGLKNAVIDWMKSSYDHHLGEIDRRAQDGDKGWDRFYMTLSEEKDAYGIEGFVSKKILERIGKRLPRDANVTPPV